jgi:hypothetical protein
MKALAVFRTAEGRAVSTGPTAAISHRSWKRSEVRVGAVLPSFSTDGAKVRQLLDR